jgi:hypothetical protein
MPIPIFKVVSALSKGPEGAGKWGKCLPRHRRSLHADFQNNGVRCWFAPHDMPIGAKIIDAFDEALRQRDKVLLILSQDAIASDWSRVRSQWLSTRSAHASNSSSFQCG